ncbi:MAG: hypothetical protein ACPG7R_06155 [Planctomycetota bacterium]
MGQIAHVLIEKTNSDGGGEGMSREGLRVRVREGDAVRGQEIPLLLESVEGDKFLARHPVREARHA